MRARAATAALLLLLAAGCAADTVVSETEGAVNSGGTPGTYDPCLPPPTGVKRVGHRTRPSTTLGSSRSWPPAEPLAPHTRRREIPLCLGSPSGPQASSPTGAPPTRRRRRSNVAALCRAAQLLVAALHRHTAPFPRRRGAPYNATSGAPGLNPCITDQEAVGVDGSKQGNYQEYLVCGCAPARSHLQADRI